MKIRGSIPLYDHELSSYSNTNGLADSGLYHDTYCGGVHHYLLPHQKRTKTMKLTKSQPEDKPEPTVALKNTCPGEVIRFAHDTIEDAFKADLFWMRLDAPEAKERVRLVNLADGKQMERDGDHRCIVHKCTLHLDLA